MQYCDSEKEEKHWFSASGRLYSGFACADVRAADRHQSTIFLTIKSHSTSHSLGSLLQSFF